MPLTVCMFKNSKAALQDSLDADAASVRAAAGLPPGRLSAPAMPDAVVVSGLRAFASAPDEAWPSWHVSARSSAHKQGREGGRAWAWRAHCSSAFAGKAHLAEEARLGRTWSQALFSSALHMPWHT
jgi:hypothetical protein